MLMLIGQLGLGVALARAGYTETDLLNQSKDRDTQIVQQINYDVKSGDTVSEIAWTHGTTTYHIEKENRLANDKLSIGQKLTVPNSKSSHIPTQSKSSIVPKKQSSKVDENSSQETSRTVTMLVTAYSSEQGTGEGLIMANGQHVFDGAIAAPPDIPFGTKIEIKGRTYTVCDRGGAITGNHLDVYMNTTKQAEQWGSQTLQVQILN